MIVSSISSLLLSAPATISVNINLNATTATKAMIDYTVMTSVNQIDDKTRSGAYRPTSMSFNLIFAFL